MGTHAHPAQVLFRGRARDSLLIHTTRVSVVFVVAANSSFDLNTIELPEGYHNATVNISLNALLQPSFRELNPDVVAITHPKLHAVDQAILTNTFLHLHVQQHTFYSLGLPAAARAAEHEPRVISIARTAKPASSRVQSCLETLGSTIMRVSTGNCALRLPSCINGNVVVEQSEIKPHNNQFCASRDTILDATSILRTQDEQHTMQLLDHVQQLIYNSPESALKDSATCGAPTLCQDTRVLVTTYNGYCTARLVNDALQCARKAVSKASECEREVVWAAVLAVAPQSAPISWRVPSSGKVLADEQQHRTRAAEMFFVAKDSCVAVQLKHA